MPSDKKWTDAQGQPIECIHRFSRNLVGLTHPNKNGKDRLALVRALPKGCKLVLVPEPDNPVDRNAVLIYSADDLENDLGYLHSSAAKQICRMIECGATFSAELAYIYDGGKKIPTVILYLYQLTPMHRSRRPIRKGAPEYKPEPPTWMKQHTSEPHIPSFESVESRPSGILSRLKDFLSL